MDFKKPQNENNNQRRVSTPYLRQLISDFYRTALTDYEKAGSPFGPRTDAMLIWFEYGQETTAN